MKKILIAVKSKSFETNAELETLKTKMKTRINEASMEGNVVKVISNLRELDSVTFDCDIEAVEIIGFYSDLLVVFAALVLKNRFPKIKIVVDASCCMGNTHEFHVRAIDLLLACGICVSNRT